jgi:hypothetical protein
MIGICSHHNDYRLVWGINDVLELHLSKAHEDFIVVNKKGTFLSQHSLYEYKDEDNLLEYYLIKNKHFGKFLIHEKPSIDYFLFIYGIDYEDLDGISQKLKQLSSVLAIFPLDPMEIESTENLIFR